MKQFSLTYGGLSKLQLITRLKEFNIKLNGYAETLFNSTLFKVSDQRVTVTLTELSLDELGFTTGTTLQEIFKVAASYALFPCSVDVAPFLRLDYAQNNSHGLTKTGRTPADAVVIASQILEQDHSFPKGFYLRKIDGELWLRAYICDDVHKFAASEIFIFAGIFTRQ